MCVRDSFRIFLGLLLYLCTSSLASNAGSIWLEPAAVIVRYGDPVSVNCTTNYTEYEFMDWEVPQGESQKISDQIVNWKASSVTEWTMNPSCFVSVDSDKGIQPRVNPPFILYKTPDSVSIHPVGSVIEGQQCELQCDIQNVAPVRFLTVNWYKGDSLVDNTTFTETIKTPVNSSPTLKITPSRHDSGALYRCEAVLNFGPEGPQPPPTVTSEPFSITVKYGPDILCPNYATVIEGKMFNPNCTTEGFPKPEFYWSKDGMDVNFPIKMDKDGSGQYHLITGNISHILEIEVLHGPSNISELIDMMLDHGHDNRLKCSSYANPPPKYRWEYKNASNVWIENVDGVSFLHIEYPTRDNIGNYTCIAYNELESVRQSANIDVQGDPDKVSLSTVGHTGPMIEGRQYELRCDVPFVPPVHRIITKMFKGDELIGTFAETLNFTEDLKMVKSTTMQIYINRTDNGTQYTCKAEMNRTRGFMPLGQSDPLSVVVHYKPVINNSKLPSVVPVFRGYPEVLECEAEGYPHPTITWTKKANTEVVGGNLIISEATNENVGLYNCTASNSVDSTVRVVKVIMKEDYLPLIAGIVALVVVSTSIVFVVFYSIYYKNTRMGHYTVEGAKPSAQNGDVAQNGKGSTIPMKKLSV